MSSFEHETTASDILLILEQHDLQTNVASIPIVEWTSGVLILFKRLSWAAHSATTVTLKPPPSYIQSQGHARPFGGGPGPTQQQPQGHGGPFSNPFQ